MSSPQDRQPSPEPEGFEVDPNEHAPLRPDLLGQEAQVEARKGILEDDDGLFAFVMSMCHETGVNSQVVMDEMVRLRRTAEPGALFAPVPEVGEDGEGTEDAEVFVARQCLIHLETLGIDFDPDTRRPVSFNIAFDRPIMPFSMVDTKFRSLFDVRGRTLPGGVSPELLMARFADESIGLVNTTRTFRETPFPVVREDGTSDVMILDMPLFTSTMYRPPDMPNAHFVVGSASVVAVAPGIECLLDADHVDPLDCHFPPRKGIMESLCIGPYEKPADGADPKVPPRYPSSQLGKKPNPVVDEDFLDWEKNTDDDSATLRFVKLKTPMVWVMDKFTAAVLRLPNGRFMPFVPTRQFQIFQRARDTVNLHRDRMAADPTSPDLPEKDYQLAMFNARAALVPFAMHFRAFDVNPHLDIIGDLKRHMEGEMLAGSIDEDGHRVVDEQTEKDLIAHYMTLYGKRDFECHQTANILDCTKHEGDPGLVHPGHLFALTRIELMARLAKEHGFEGVDDETFAREFLARETTDPFVCAMHKQFIDVLGAVSSIASIVFPVLHSVFINRIKRTEAREISPEDERDAAARRLVDVRTRVSLNAGEEGSARNEMNFVFPAGQCIDLENMHSNIRIPDEMGEKEEVEAHPENPNADPKVASILAFCKREGIPIDLYKAVLTKDTGAINEIIRRRTEKINTNVSTEHVKNRAIQMAQEHQVIASNEEKFSEYINSAEADMRIIENDQGAALKLLNVLGHRNGALSMIALSAANAGLTVEIAEKPLNPRGDTYLAVMAKVAKVQLLPAAVGMAIAELCPDASTVRHTTWSLYAQVSSSEDPTQLAIAAQRDMAKVPRATHAAMGFQLCAAFMLAAKAVESRISGPEEINRVGWVEFSMAGRVYETTPFLLFSEPLGVIARQGDVNVYRLRDPCPFIPDMVSFKPMKAQYLQDGSTIYAIRPAGDHASCILLNSVVGFNMLYAHMPGGRFFETGKGPQEDKEEWEGLAAGLFGSVDETSGPMFSMVFDDAGPKLSNPFHIDVFRTCACFGWNDEIVPSIESQPCCDHDHTDDPPVDDLNTPSASE
jgi:hypothetical protein